MYKESPTNFMYSSKYINLYEKYNIMIYNRIETAKKYKNNFVYFYYDDFLKTYMKYYIIDSYTEDEIIKVVFDILEDLRHENYEYEDYNTMNNCKYRFWKISWENKKCCFLFNIKWQC